MSKYEPWNPNYEPDFDDILIDRDKDWASEADDWASKHMNPRGTIDCGDGYVNDDGVFIEY